MEKKEEQELASQLPSTAAIRRDGKQSKQQKKGLPKCRAGPHTASPDPEPFPLGPIMWPGPKVPGAGRQGRKTDWDNRAMMDWVEAGEALGQSRVGTRPLYSPESPSSPLPTAQPCIPPLPQWCGWGEGCPGHLQYPERPRQGSDRPAEGGSACGLSASLAMSAGAGRADSKWPLGWGAGRGQGEGPLPR